MSLFPERIVAFWNVLGVHTVAERLEYAHNNFPFVYGEGPLLGIGAALASQMRRKYESGNAFDCLHAAYLPYIDTFYTQDAGLLALAVDFPRSAHMRRMSDVHAFLDRYVVA